MDHSPEKLPSADGRRIYTWIMEGLGGLTVVNALLVARDVPAGCNEWIEKFGPDDLDFDRVKP